MITNNDLVSIWIPTYNRPEYLKLLITSILKQTYQEFEVIIYDDWSPKASEIQKVVSEFNDKRIQLFLWENVGFVKNRNRVLKKCKWAYIKIVWDDDILLDSCIEQQKEVLERDSKIWLVCCNYSTIDENGIMINDKYFNHTSFRLFNISRKENWKDLIKNFFLWKRRIWLPTSMMFPSKIKQEVWFFNEHIWCPADIEYWIRICAKYDFYYIDKELIQMRRHRNNLSKELNKQIDSFESIIFHIFKNGYNEIKNIVSVNEKAIIFVRYVYASLSYINIKNIRKLFIIYAFLLHQLSK